MGWWNIHYGDWSLWNNGLFNWCFRFCFPLAAREEVGQSDPWGSQSNEYYNISQHVLISSFFLNRPKVIQITDDHDFPCIVLFHRTACWRFSVTIITAEKPGEPSPGPRWRSQCSLAVSKQVAAFNWLKILTGAIHNRQACFILFPNTLWNHI